MTVTIWTRRGPRCHCPRTQEFADHPGNCHKCGHTTRTTSITATLATALAEIMLGHRKLHNPNAQ